MSKSCVIFFLISCMLWAATPVGATDDPIATVLPAPVCADGWSMAGKVVLYDKNNLFERINGEAELYFPYGFEVLASARYAHPRNPQVAIEADVYKMGSRLDAFGMYANYRRTDDTETNIGAGGTISSSQLFFYQDRYFVRLQVTGTTSLGPEIFLACARAIAQNLPRNRGRPRELEAFTIPAVERNSERYIAQSLLGYDFFRRGVIADAVLNGAPVQLFLIPEDSRETARKSFDQYRTYLKTAGKELRVTELPDKIALQAVDPLYGNVVIEQTGRFIYGTVRGKEATSSLQLIEQLRKKAGSD